MNIIRCDNEEMVSKVPYISDKLENHFKDQNIVLFVCMDDNNEIGFIGRCGNECLYIDDSKTIPFGIKKNSTINYYYKDGYNLFPEGYEDVEESGVCCQDSKGIMHTVMSYPMKFDDFEGAFSYFQYSEKTDTLCEIRYKHYYRKDMEKSPIYEYYKSRMMESVYIDREYSKSKENKKGFIPSSSSHYELFSCDAGTMGYNMIAISEYGLLKVLLNGSYNLLKEQTANRYVKSFYVTKDDDYLEMIWPLCKFNKVEDIKKEVTDLGFGLEVPSVLLTLYNGYDKDKDMLDELIHLMDDVIKKEDNTRLMLLRKRSV